ncbi:ribosome biogenesis factor YjgA [Rehaibacterium terrae]|jgi:ribosome-associated protein|uniref:Dual-action ribosomal maturation protein DarP n=1 Tax=Rehaibacterium terrae TaxID=1341696 RepID=A0A7W7Y097_9GAMM|nr:ribosome biogenesis factor YjgA [Rehaibacterium terrae]MBB5015716.1 ribosome-associated protein [Rehaibacterium terrae]
MRGRDEETGEYFSPSRAQQRREAMAVFELGEKLVALSEAELLRLPIPEHLLAEIRHTRRITSHIARKRELQHLAKIMRREDEETLDAIRKALEHDKAQMRRETAALHRVEAWRDRLVADGDQALAELLAQHPQADRQHLRQLARNAREERLRNKPPHAFRELFRELRELLEEQETGSR